jgi:hypothetical protein
VPTDEGQKRRLRQHATAHVGELKVTQPEHRLAVKEQRHQELAPGAGEVDLIFDHV